MTRLSAVMIARDEAEHVRPCLESLWDKVDEVVLCDTGSTDDTVNEARAYALLRGQKDKLIVGRFKWCDDFAAARTHAHSLATGDVHLALDLDDRLVGDGARAAADMLAASDEVEAVTVWLEDAADPYHRAGIKRGAKTQMFRAPVVWMGPTWEFVPVGPLDELGMPQWVRGLQEGSYRHAEDVCLRHTRDHHRSTRDVDIAERWAANATDERERLRALFVAAREAVILRQYERVLRACDQALTHEMAGPVRRAFQGFKAAALRGMGQLAEARALADHVLEEGDIAWEDEVDAWHTLAVCSHHQGDWETTVRATLNGLLIMPSRGNPDWACAIGFDAACRLRRWGDAQRIAHTAIQVVPRGSDQQARWQERKRQMASRIEEQNKLRLQWLASLDRKTLAQPGVAPEIGMGWLRGW